MPFLYDFDRQVKEWETPPIGGRNIRSASLRGWSAEQLKTWIIDQWPLQYGPAAGEDTEGKYRRFLQLDTTYRKRVLDFGCGFGFDALSYALTQNQVSIADLNSDNLEAASKVLGAFGFKPRETVLVSNRYPYFYLTEPIDVFHASGVLHHIPYAGAIIDRALDFLAEDGELRLMLYTDHLFERFMGRPPDPRKEVHDESGFEVFVRACDAIGYYTDWYDEEKIRERLCGSKLRIDFFGYLRPDRGNCVVILKRG